LLVLSTTSGVTTINLAVTAGTDETTGDSVTVTNFESIDATSFTTSLNIIGSSAYNGIRGGSGGNTIDGGGGADQIYAGSGDDRVYYHGSEALIDGQGGVNTFVLSTAVNVNLANSADQTSADTTTVVNFQNVDASAISGNISLTAAASGSRLVAGSGTDSLIGSGGNDTLVGGSGSDSFTLDATGLNLGATATGNSSSNTLSIQHSGTVTDTELYNQIHNVQTIDFTAGTAVANLNLSGAQIASISGSANNTLNIHMNASDSVNVTDPAANYTKTVSGPAVTYTIYDDNLHTHLIAQLHVA